MTTPINRSALGALMLENAPLTFRGCIGDAASFKFPVIYKTVPGAWAKRVMEGDQTLTEAYIESARQLIGEGAVALITNCGFNIRIQRELAAAMRVPVAASSLVLLPYLNAIRPQNGRIGIVTADATLFAHDFIEMAGIAVEVPIAIAGIEGSKS